MSVREEARVALSCHYVDGSPFARMLRVLARETGLAMDEIEIVEFPPPPEFFTLNPMGQVPVLVIDGTPRFPTETSLAAIMEAAAAQGLPSHLAPGLARPGNVLDDRQVLSVIFALGAEMVALNYRRWAGLAPSGPNRLGFDLDARALKRIAAALDWLTALLGPEGFRPDGLSVQDVALTCILLWADSRGGPAWRGRPALDALADRLALRPSFTATAPRAWEA